MSTRGPTVAAGFAFTTGFAGPLHAQAAPTPGQSMLEFLTATRDMVDQGRYAEALERTLWYHEHALEVQPSSAAPACPSH